MIRENRINGLDILKFLCTFLVICIHYSFPGTLGQITVPICRIAVPIFFLITGYFYTSTKEKNKCLNQIKKIFKYFLLSNILYLLYFITTNLIKGNSLIIFFKNVFSLKSIFEFLFLNESPFCIHLWYLGAILYVLIFIYIFDKKNNRTKLYYLIPVLLIGNLILGSYSNIIFGQTINYFWSRNFLFLGLPYFLLGDLLYNKKIKINNNLTIPIFIISLITTILENFITIKLGAKVMGEHFISTIFCAIAIFEFMINNNSLFKNRLWTFLSFIGSKLTIYTYIIHPLIIVIVSKGLSLFNKIIFIQKISPYLAPLIVLIVSTLISYCIYLFFKTINQKKEEN